MKNSKALWVSKTAIMLALLLVLQFVTKSFGQIVTGSCVNFVLVSTALICGLSSGIVIALISPFAAFLLGIGPMFFPITPCIAIANVVIVLISSLIKKGIETNRRSILNFVIVVLAAIAKFICIYVLVVKLVIPSLGLSPEKVAVISASFSYPQLITALIGGVFSVIIAPLIIKALKH